jgi:hypothetical protein
LAGIDPGFDLAGPLRHSRRNTMAFFDDMTQALETYPATNVVIEIVNFKPVTGTALNVNEDATFEVKVTNKGPLNLTNVRLHLEAQNDAKLHDKVGAGLLLDTLNSLTLLEIHGDGGAKITETFRLKAPSKPTKPGKTEDLVKVTLDAWDANLDRILIDHSNPLDAVKATKAAEVVAA